MTRLSARYSCHIQLHTRIAYCVEEGVNFKRHVNTWVAPIAYQSTVHDKHSFGLVFITGTTNYVFVEPTSSNRARTTRYVFVETTSSNRARTTCYVFVETTSSNQNRIDASIEVEFDDVISLPLIFREMGDEVLRVLSTE